MIRISNSTDEEVRDFGKIEWPFANREHYGIDVDYRQKDFVLKATEDKNIVGSVKCSHEGGVLKIHYLIVAHNKRGQGIGRQLMEKVEALGKRFGAHKVHLNTGEDWKATKFYEKLGYKRVAVLPNHNFHKDFVIYEKFI